MDDSYMDTSPDIPEVPSPKKTAIKHIKQDTVTK